MQLLNELGKRLKTIRIYSGIKQKDLAKKLSVPASLLSMYEQGKREPSITFLISFCENFNMSLSQLFSFHTSPNEDSVSIEHKNLIQGLQSLLKDLERDKLKLMNA